MERNYSNIKKDASSKLFDLILKGSVKEAKKILIELSEKSQKSHEIGYLKGLENILESVRDPQRVIEAIDELKEQQFEIGRFLTEEEIKALADLRNYYNLKNMHKRLWKNMKNRNTKRLPFLFINFIDFSEGTAELRFFFLQELENFFGTLLPCIG